MKKKSWKTTTLGILAAAGIIIAQSVALLDGDPNTVFDFGEITLALGALGVGWFARDNNVNSEDAGAK
jgi:hypothetical protein